MSDRPRRGALKLPEHSHPFVRRLVEEMNDQLASFEDVAERTSIGVATMKKWRYQTMPRLDTFEAALNCLDLELRVVRRYMKADA